MGITSSTTAAAFIANYFSPIMPIRSLGIFGAIVIPMNYILVIFVFPPAVILYENRIRGVPTLRNIICKPCKKKGVTTFQNKIESFFETKWSDFVKKFKYCIIAAVVIWSSFAIS